MRIRDWSSDVCSSDLSVTSVMRPEEPRSKVRLRLTSTVTALERPWLKLWRTWPVSTVFFSCSLPGRLSFNGCLASDSLLVRSEEHTSELQSIMRLTYAVFCLKQNKETLTIEIN